MNNSGNPPPQSPYPPQPPNYEENIPAGRPVSQSMYPPPPPMGNQQAPPPPPIYGAPMTGVHPPPMYKGQSPAPYTGYPGQANVYMYVQQPGMKPPPGFTTEPKYEGFREDHPVKGTQCHGLYPEHFVCKHCNYMGDTLTQPTMGWNNYCQAAILTIFCCSCWIPFVCEGCQNKRHIFHIVHVI